MLTQSVVFVQPIVGGVIGRTKREVILAVNQRLRLRERSNNVTVAPAHGLCLVEVGYPGDPAEFERQAEATRRRRDPIPALPEG